MKIFQPEFEILNVNELGVQCLKKIELAARITHESKDKITETSCFDLVKMLIDRHHDAMIEFGGDIQVRFITDRGVGNEEIRQRPADMIETSDALGLPAIHEVAKEVEVSYAQESTRYVNYTVKELGFIQPPFAHPESLDEWMDLGEHSERVYNSMIARGETPQIARSSLLISTKSEIVLSANLREWIHILEQRTAPAAHPQMRELMIPLLIAIRELIPIIFDHVGCIEF